MVGKTIPVTITGANFVVGATVVEIVGTGVTLTDVTVESATSITANVVIAANASLGDAELTVTTAVAVSAAQAFTVLPLVPVALSVSPSFGSAGDTIPVTLTGRNFVPGATTVTVASAVTVTNVSVTSATSLTANFVAPNAAVGGTVTIYFVTVKTAGGTTTLPQFEVLPPSP